MELKLTDRSGGRYIAYHILVAIAYLAIILVPGQVYPGYHVIVGTILFVLVSFLSARSYALACFALTRPPLGTPPKGDMPRVSLIIPSCNEEAVLERTIPAVLAVDYPPDKIEFIYVYESICTDQTEEIILRYAAQDDRVKPLRHPTSKGGKAAVTNYALQFASGDIIGMLDADHSPNRDIVKRAADYLQNPNVGCVRGRCRTINREQNIITLLFALERDVVERLGIYGAAQMGGFANFGGGQGFFRRDVFEAIGLFNEDILTEDIEFSVRLNLAGYDILVHPQIESWEEAPASLRAVIAQRKRWSRGWMQVWRLHSGHLLQAKSLSVVKRIDTLMSLTVAVVSGILITVIPSAILSLLGTRTSCLGTDASFWLWIVVCANPTITACLVWVLDRRTCHPPHAADLLMAGLLLPYIVFLFVIGWISLIDEFLLNWPYAYVKTKRANETVAPHDHNAAITVMHLPAARFSDRPRMGVLLVQKFRFPGGPVS